jgi:hypothetical protein
MPRRTPEIWRNVIGQLERSGKTTEQFAAERQIPVGTVRNWIYRLKSEQAEEAAAILPVRGDKLSWRSSPSRNRGGCHLACRRRVMSGASQPASVGTRAARRSSTGSDFDECNATRMRAAVWRT